MELISKLEEIRKIGIIAMFSDDELMEKLVLKGGNAISLICPEYSRASTDLDFGMNGGIEAERLSEIEHKIKRTLETTFSERGYTVFDFDFSPRPLHRREGMMEIWGGYRIEFKVVEKANYSLDDIRRTRNMAITLGSNNKKAFSIDISKFDYTNPKQEHDLDGYTVYVYSPEMVVVEKIRAICQKMPEYRHGNKKARARDFYDIYLLMERFSLDLMSAKNLELIRLIFGAKEVPLSLIANIKQYREYHRVDFPSVVATVISPEDLKEFGFYFDYVVSKTEKLKILWEV